MFAFYFFHSLRWVQADIVCNYVVVMTQEQQVFKRPAVFISLGLIKPLAATLRCTNMAKFSDIRPVLQNDWVVTIGVSALIAGQQVKPP
ncbi:hypothetical protein C6366_16610 [Desulfonatronum sp. SC1]|nr:hypothetical protein C6366_16610 [Desulfonatronum sp. SC1]